MNSNPVGWFEIYVQDMFRAKAFYEGVLGITLEELQMPDIEMWSFPMDPELTGSSGSLIRVPGAPSGGNSTLVYFSCEDCAGPESRAEAFGGSVERPKMAVGSYGFVSMLKDTEGNLVGFHSQK
jgi:predicted enzyme related to lactoylglutathione lyase